MTDDTPPTKPDDFDGDDLDPHPEDHARLAAFKQAWYDEHGTGTWLDDIKLAFAYFWARDERLPSNLRDVWKNVKTDD